MVATLIRLKLRLMGNSFTRSAWQIVGTVLMLVYGLGMATMAFMIQTTLGGESGLQTLRTASVLMGAGVMLFWVVIPLFLTGGDNLMDPRQFVTYAVPRPQLILGLVAAALISIGSVITLVWLAGQLMLWRGEPAALLTAALTLPLLLVLFSMVSQACTTVMAAWFGGKRARDAVAIIGVGLAVISWPLISSLQEAFGSLRGALPAIAEVLAWTPLGAAAALPADAAAGDWGALALRSAMAAGTAALALLLIRAGLIRITERPSVAAGRRRRAKGGKLGLFSVFPASPWGAVAARALTYWFRDPRYGGSLIVLPGIVVLAVFMSAQSEAVWTLYALGPFLAWMLGYSISADVSYDSSAFALHVTTGVSGAADRAGRVAALLAFAVPVTLVAAVVPAALVGGPEQLVMAVTLSLSTLLTGAGMSAFVSAWLTYPTPKPGESPFKTPQGAAGRMMVIQFGTLAVQGILMLPEITLWLLWFLGGADWALPAVVVAAALKSGLLLWAGIVLGGRLFDRSRAELFQRVSSYA